MGTEPENRNLSNEDIPTLLAELRGPSPDAAWQSFLNRFSAQIMHVVRQREYGAQQASDCFLFVCECLSDDGFGRLQQFDPGRGVSFRAWLNAVAGNLCIEWHRRQYGRARPPPGIERLSSLDQSVFHHRYRQNLDRQTCFQLLREVDPQLSPTDFSASLARVQAALTWRQRWSLAREQGRFFVQGDNPPSLSDVPDSGPNPEQRAALGQRRDRLRRALDELEPEERLLLRLRYEQDLSLAEAARVAQLPNLHAARRRIESALRRLAGLLDGDDAA